MLAAGFVFFQVGFKRGFVLVQMLFWSFILTDFSKEFLHWPRPIQVDPSILTFNEYLPDWLVESVANNPGFPSGHVCSTVVFWGAVLISFAGAFKKIITIALVTLMPLSRMYLGRHFLGDVLGGWLLGLLILLIGFLPLMRSQRDGLFLESPHGKGSYTYLLAGYLILLPVLLNLISFFPSTELGELFGFNIVIFCILFFGFFQILSTGLTQFFVAVLIFVTMNLLLSILGDFPNRWMHFFRSAIPMSSALLIAKFPENFLKKGW